MFVSYDSDICDHDVIDLSKIMTDVPPFRT